MSDCESIKYRLQLIGETYLKNSAGVADKKFWEGINKELSETSIDVKCSERKEMKPIEIGFCILLFAVFV